MSSYNISTRFSSLVLILGLVSILSFSCKKDAAVVPVTETEEPVDSTLLKPYTLVFIGDSEPRMRGNTDEEIRGYVNNIIQYKYDKEVYFDYIDGNTFRVIPEIVILAGDISADRSTSIQADMPIWRELYENGIIFIAGFGNHDWDPQNFGDDGPGYSVSGHLSNEDTKAFCRETYRRSRNTNPLFSYTELGPTSEHGPVTFYANYKNTNIINFNTFLYHPSYYYPSGWPFNCNLLLGGAGCQIFVSAEEQITAMEALIPSDPDQNYIFFQHYPFTTGNNWWDDYGASNTTINEKKDRLMSMIVRNPRSIFLAGHNHTQAERTLSFNGSTFKEYIAPYFGGNNGVDSTQGGKFYAFLVSPTEGILEVKVLK